MKCALCPISANPTVTHLPLRHYVALTIIPPLAISIPQPRPTNHGVPPPPLMATIQLDPHQHYELILNQLSALIHEIETDCPDTKKARTSLRYLKTARVNFAFLLSATTPR